MFDADFLSYNSKVPPPAQHFCRDTPQELGVSLVDEARRSVATGQMKIATYDVAGQWFRFMAGGDPFAAYVFAIRPGGDTLIFKATEAGFDFGDTKNLTTVGAGLRDAVKVAAGHV